MTHRLHIHNMNNFFKFQFDLNNFFKLEYPQYNTWTESDLERMRPYKDSDSQTHSDIVIRPSTTLFGWLTDFISIIWTISSNSNILNIRLWQRRIQTELECVHLLVVKSILLAACQLCLPALCSSSWKYLIKNVSKNNDVWLSLEISRTVSKVQWYSVFFSLLCTMMQNKDSWDCQQRLAPY